MRRLVAGLAALALGACGGFEIGSGGTSTASVGGPACVDGEKSGGETDADCGGPCAPCPAGKACLAGSDCESGACVAGKCAKPACSDGAQNEGETGVDCGGPCPPCAAGQGCQKAKDCASGVCAAGYCAAPGCSDRVKNGAETDVDCGGPSCAPCSFGAACAVGADCGAGHCAASGRCEPEPVPVWEARAQVQQPTPRYDGALAYDRQSHKTILAGGFNGVPLGDTWAWDGDQWSQAATGGFPPTYVHSMTFDATLGKVLLVGGIGNGAVPYAWDGAAWAAVAPGPPADYQAVLAYDEKRAQSAYFGGALGAGTWIFGGAAWTQATPAAVPSHRYGAAMVYDSVLAAPLLFGGSVTGAAGSELAESWTFDGASWTLLAPPVSPPARLLAAMAHDSHHAVTILWGGAVANGALYFQDTWAFDGTTWRLLDIPGPPPYLANGMAYDADRRRMVLSLYGAPAGVPVHQTWELHWLAVSCTSDAECGSAHCADGLCCDSACSDPCQTCGSPGSPGRCAKVTLGDDDTCNGTSTCDAAGACVARN